MIGDDVEITIVDVRGDKVRLGITAPKQIPVHRREIYDAIQREKAEASSANWPMPESIQDTFEEFMKIAKKKNITRLNEWNEGFGALEKALERTKK